MLFGSRVRITVSVMVVVRVVWLVSGYAYVFILLSVVIVTLPYIIRLVTLLQFL